MSVALAWTATALGGSFSRYEIQRQNPDATWWDIAHITTEATNTYTDREPRLGVVETYRIGVRHTNGTIGYSASDTATTTAGQSWKLCSNADTIDLTILPNQGAQATFPRDSQVDARFGQTFQTVTTLEDDRGLTLDFTLDLRPLSTELMVGLFDQVRQLPGKTLALLNPFGERWWGAVLNNGGPLTVDNFTQADLTFVQTSDHPEV